MNLNHPTSLGGPTLLLKHCPSMVGMVWFIMGLLSYPQINGFIIRIHHDFLQPFFRLVHTIFGHKHNIINMCGVEIKFYIYIYTKPGSITCSTSPFSHDLLVRNPSSYLNCDHPTLLDTRDSTALFVCLKFNPYEFRDNLAWRSLKATIHCSFVPNE